MPRAGGQAAEPHAAQHRPHAALGQTHAEVCLDHPRQVDPAPAHHTVCVDVRSFADQLGQLRFLLGRQPRLGPRRHAIGQARHAEIIVAMHPVAQCLTIHAALRGRVAAADALQYKRKRQHPPRGGCVPRLRCGTPKTSRIQVHSSDCYSSRHDLLRESMQSQANHIATALGIPRESKPRAAGITSGFGSSHLVDQGRGRYLAAAPAGARLTFSSPARRQRRAPAAAAIHRL